MSLIYCASNSIDLAGVMSFFICMSIFWLCFLPGVKNKQKLNRDSSSTTMDKFCGQHEMYYSFGTNQTNV